MNPVGAQRSGAPEQTPFLERSGREEPGRLRRRRGKKWMRGFHRRGDSHRSSTPKSRDIGATDTRTGPAILPRSDMSPRTTTADTRASSRGITVRRPSGLKLLISSPQGRGHIPTSGSGDTSIVAALPRVPSSQSLDARHGRPRMRREAKCNIAGVAVPFEARGGRRSIIVPRRSNSAHVWTLRSKFFFDVSASWSSALMCPACLRGAHDRWALMEVHGPGPNHLPALEVLGTTRVFPVPRLNRFIAPPAVGNRSHQWLVGSMEQAASKRAPKWRRSEPAACGQQTQTVVVCHAAALVIVGSR